MKKALLLAPLLIFTNLGINHLKSQANSTLINDHGISSSCLDSLANNYSEQIYTVLKHMPTFTQGNPQAYLAQQVKYPADALKKGIQGNIYCRFIIRKDGRVTDPEILRGGDTLLEKEALRVVSNMPKWNPGKKGGKPVDSYYTIPIRFKLEKSPTATDQLCKKPDVLPYYKGGVITRILAARVIYPKDAVKKNIQGKVYCQFIVRKDGSITDVQVIRGHHHSLNLEAVRVISNSPKWEPGLKDGEPVDCYFTLPISFKLQR